ncbi:uncharacterized protein ACR2FA_012226 [Aphomia sociella]
MDAIDEINSLQLDTDCTVSKTKCLSLNISGRPTNKKIIKFGPQPRSIISQLLQKIKQDQANAARVEDDKKEKNKLIVSPDQREVMNGKVKKKKRFRECFLEGKHKHSADQVIMASHNDSKTEENYILCQICSQRSSNIKEHRKHLTTHKDKQFVCDYTDCSYTCKLSSNLIKHKRIHTSEKPYLCDKCSFRSNFVNSLKVHKRIHTSERPYGCTHCSYRCNSSSNLKKHCRHRHWDVVQH